MRRDSSAMSLPALLQHRKESLTTTKRPKVRSVQPEEEEEPKNLRDILRSKTLNRVRPGSCTLVGFRKSRSVSGSWKRVKFRRAGLARKSVLGRRKRTRGRIETHYLNRYVNPCSINPKDPYETAFDNLIPVPYHACRANRDPVSRAKAFQPHPGVEGTAEDHPF